MKIILFILLIFLVPFSLQAAPKKPVYAAIVMDHKSNKVLHSENAHQITYPASLTKMMTLYLVFEALQRKKIKLSTRLNVSQYACDRPPSKLGLKPGQKITVQDAMLALVVKSANDAAVVLAEHLGKTEQQFALMMTKKARALGMKQTVFKNASGLPHRDQVTTAHDMCLLTQALYKKFPGYYRYFKTKYFLFNGQKYRSHNRLVGKCAGVDGVKTGFITASGFNLATSAKRGNERLFAVVLGGKTVQWRDKRMEQLIDSSFSRLPSFKKIPASSPLLSVHQLVKNFIPPTKPLILDSIEEDTADAIQDFLQKNSGNLIPVALATPLEEQDQSAKNADSKAWAAQFGAFKDKEQAQENAALITTLIPDLPGVLTVTPFPSDQRTLYRTRLIQLTKEEAANVCKKMHFHDIPCLPIHE